MSFSDINLLQFPGVLILAGILLLVIVVIIGIVSVVKNKKGTRNIDKPATYNNPEVPQTNMVNPMGQPAMNEPSPMFGNSPMGESMDSNPMGMPTVDNGPFNPQPSFAEPSVAPVMENNNPMNNPMDNPMNMNGNPMGMPAVEPVVEEKPVVDIVPPVTPVVEPEKKEPLTNPWANATSAYGGANPMDGVNLNFNQGPQEPYGEKNFVASETPTINAMPKEEAVVMPTINTEVPKTGDDVETL